MNVARSRFIALAFAAGAALGIASRTPAAAAAEPACFAPSTWLALDGAEPRGASATAVISSMAKKDVVLIGEQHDEDDDHRWQLQVLAALHAQRPNMAIGLEMLPRRAQPVLDKWVAGKLTVKELLEQSQWETVWGLPAELYLPLFQFARINRIPMLALNIDKKLVRAVTEKGWDAVPEADREGVSRPLAPSRAYRDYLFDIYAEHANPHAKDSAKPQPSDAAFMRFVEAQTTWDRAMAQILASAAASAKAGDKPLVVGIMGSGHIRFGYGVPHQLRDLGVKSVGTLVPVRNGIDCKELRTGFADAVFNVPEMAKAVPEPPRLGVSLEQDANTVRVASVTAGSLAERSGLKSGDVIVEVAGVPVNRPTRVIAVVRAAPAGTWVPMKLKRGDDTLEVVVKFPPKP